MNNQQAFVNFLQTLGVTEKKGPTQRQYWKYGEDPTEAQIGRAHYSETYGAQLFPAETWKSSRPKAIKSTFDLVKLMMNYAGKNDVRYYLNGVAVDLYRHNYIATNGHVMALVSDNEHEEDPTFSTLITQNPRNTAGVVQDEKTRWQKMWETVEFVGKTDQMNQHAGWRVIDCTPPDHSIVMAKAASNGTTTYQLSAHELDKLAGILAAYKRMLRWLGMDQKPVEYPNIFLFDQSFNLDYVIGMIKFFRSLRAETVEFHVPQDKSLVLRAQADTSRWKADFYLMPTRHTKAEDSSFRPITLAEIVA